MAEVNKCMAGGADGRTIRDGESIKIGSECLNADCSYRLGVTHAMIAAGGLGGFCTLRGGPTPPAVTKSSQ